MNKIFNKALLQTIEKLLTNPPSKRALKKNQDIIQRNSEEMVRSLMEEIDTYSKVIKDVVAKHGHVDEGYKFFTTFPLIRISIVDLHILNFYLAKETDPYRERFLLRSIALTIYELSNNIDTVLGKSFRTALRIFPNHYEILSELDKAGKSFNAFRKQYGASLGTIRNLTIAHKDRNLFKQIEITEDLDRIKQGLQSYMIITWFEDFKQIEKLLFAGIQLKRKQRSEQ